MSAAHFDIAVVGAGPVGSLAALSAAKAGYRVALLDAAAQPMQASPAGDFDLRVVALAPGSQAQFVALDAWPQEVAERAQAYTGMQVWDGTGRGDIRFDAAELGRENLGYMVEVPALQWALDRALQAQAGQCERWQSALCQRFDYADRGLRLYCADGRELSAEIVLAADGRDSRLRKRAGIAVERKDYQQSGVVAVVQPQQAHGAVARQVFTDEGPLGLLPLANGQISLVWSLPPERAQQMLDASDRFFCAALAQATGQPGFELISRRVAFPLILQHAQSYSQDELALIGDAAHAVHPLAGLGMNLGFEDVASLMQQLGEPGRKAAPADALRRYAQARRQAVLPAVAMIDGLDALFGSRQSAVMNVRDMGLNLVNRDAHLKQLFMRYALGTQAA